MNLHSPSLVHSPSPFSFPPVCFPRLFSLSPPPCPFLGLLVSKTGYNNIIFFHHTCTMLRLGKPSRLLVH